MVLLNVVTLKSYYTGPLAKQLNSVDISWIVGAVVTAVVYWLLTRNLDVAAEQAAIERSEAELRRIGSASGARAIAGRFSRPGTAGRSRGFPLGVVKERGWHRTGMRPALPAGMRRVTRSTR